MTAKQARETREAAITSLKLVKIFERIKNVAQCGKSVLYVSFEEMPYGGPTILKDEPYLYKIEEKRVTCRGPDNDTKSYINGYNISWE